MQKPTMKTLLGILLISSIRAQETSQPICINGIEHEKVIINEGNEAPTMLTMDYKANRLYFRHKTSLITFKTAYIDLNNNEYHGIDIKEGFAIAVDNKNGGVYIGGEDGIYKFDSNNNTWNRIGAEDIDIHSLFVKDAIYYTGHLNKQNHFHLHAFNLIDGVSKPLAALNSIEAEIVAFDKNDYLFFTNETELYRLKKDERIATIMLRDISVNSITPNKKGELFFSTARGLYRITPDGESVELLIDIDDFVYGIAVDNDDNVLYGDDDSIIKLKPTKIKCEKRTD